MKATVFRTTAIAALALVSALDTATTASAATLNVTATCRPRPSE
ncbi:MAG TPA: hypothetical protein VJT49_24730 [Amycolatopsis sp.]|nr:hypothetical protein [Amycolatopsis sp.]HKS48256.1 hypothetical protein [Amycolatopsis sp.]